MKFNASNFYIGLIDLFAILLPGAITSLVIYHFNQVDIDKFLKTGEANKDFFNGFVLLFSSYLFGHIISQVSAYLDEWVYDRFKNSVYKDHKKVERVIDIRKTNYSNHMEKQEGKMNDNEYVNTYQWSVYKLQKEYPEGAEEVERYMADSKFFRSLFVIMLVLGIILFITQADKWVSTSCFLLAAFSMVRYFKKRRKSTETAYQYIIFTEVLNTRNEDNPTHDKQVERKKI